MFDNPPAGSEVPPGIGIGKASKCKGGSQADNQDWQ
jgi:hypothetical protein